MFQDFYECFIADGMYKMYLQGLLNTFLIALGAALIGLVIGIVVTALRIMPKTNFVVKIFDWIAKLYVTIIRGTPMVLQLFICYFVIFASMKHFANGILVCSITFGINSGAYMSEILRGGILSVEKGQMEAGRSLGLGWTATFFRIILPQALKSAIPTMFNEFIMLIKETSVAGYVGINELTKVREYVTLQTGGQLYMSLFIIAIMYLVIVLGLQQVQKYIERRMTRSER